MALILQYLSQHLEVRRRVVDDEDVAFEGVGTVDLRIMKQVLRTCRSVRLGTIDVSSDHLSLVYDGTKSRGRIALIVRPAEPLDDAVVVRLGATPARAARGGGFLDYLQRAMWDAAS